jgi:hypothetical protein
MIQGIGYYQGEQVSIIESHKDKLFIVSSHNPVQTAWVNYTELDSVTWFIGQTNAA